MEKEIKNGVIKGYEIGLAISIHSHINDPESWFVTIRPLRVFAESICKKTCTEQEIVNHLNDFMIKKRDALSAILKDVDNEKRRMTWRG